MAVIFPPPFVLLEKIDGHSRAVARVTKKLSGTSIDIKTIENLLVGQGREQTAERLVDELLAHTQLSRDEIEGITPSDISSAECDLSWRMLVAGAERQDRLLGLSVEVDSVLQRHLVPLDKVSIKAMRELKAENYDRAGELVRRTLLGRFLPSEFWEAFSGASSTPEVARLISQIWRYGVLVLLAISERHFAPNKTDSILVHCLPIDEGNVGASPFARCIQRMMKVGDFSSEKEASSCLMADDGDFERKKFHRWVHGVSQPELSGFKSTYLRFHEYMSRRKRLNERLDSKEFLKGATVLYYQLKVLDWLSREPIDPYIGGNREFFAVYTEIYEAMK